MNSFSISQLSQYAGIKPHTIRVWEQRYNALSPVRSEGNTRYYDGEQLRRLLNIVSLMDFDYKVSELCSLPDDDLSALVLAKKLSVSNETNGYFVSQLISAGMDYNEALFDELFLKCVYKFGMLVTYKTIISPMLVRVGVMWSANVLPSGEEHFISNIVRRKILSSIDSLPVGNSQQTWVLFLPEDEFHEIGLLFACYILRQRGLKVVYLGSSVSMQSLYKAIEDTKPQFLLFFQTHFNAPDALEKYLRDLAVKFLDGEIYVAGNLKLLQELTFKNNIHWLRDVDSLVKLIQN